MLFKKNIFFFRKFDYEKINDMNWSLVTGCYLNTDNYSRTIASNSPRSRFFRTLSQVKYLPFIAI